MNEDRGSPVNALFNSVEELEAVKTARKDQYR